MTWVESLIDGHRVLPALLQDFASATRAIHISIFLFFDDPIGNEIADILCAKARAGVDVRVMLNVEKTDLADPFDTGEKEMMEKDPGFARDPTELDEFRRRLEDAGVEVLDSELDYDKIVDTGDPEVDRLGREIRENIDVDAMHVDHRKLVTIDGRIGWCGGANFGGQYLHHLPFDPAIESHAEADAAREAGRPEPWWKWHDGLGRFEGAIVHDLGVVFRQRWLLGGGRDFRILDVTLPEAPRGVRVDSARVIKNEPSSRTNEIRETYRARILAAERSIFIENPYLYHPAIVAALLEAKRMRPGLRVTVIVPSREWNDNKFAEDAQRHHYPALVAGGIELFEYQNHFNHLKIAVFDERWTILGSANLNFRSLEDDKDFEMSVLIASEELARGILRDVRDADLPHSKRIVASDVRGLSVRAIRMRTRDPRTLLLVRSREL